MIRCFANVGKLLQLLLICCVMALSGKAKAAETIIALPPDVRVLDLGTLGTQVAAQRRNVTLEVPGETLGTRAVLELRGEAAGPDFNWTIYSVTNQAEVPRTLVLAVGHQRLAASGFLPLKPFGTQLLKINWVKPPDTLAVIPALSDDAFGFMLAAKSTLTFAIEGPPLLHSIRLMDVNAFAQEQTTESFVKGATLAVSFILCLLIIALFGMRSQVEFVAASYFAFTSLQFMALEAGYLDRLATAFANPSFNLQHLRAISEIIMATGIAIAAWMLTAPNRQQANGKTIRLLHGLIILGAATGLLLLASGNPFWAAQFARSWLVIATTLGFYLALQARQRQTGALDFGMFFWCAVLAWTLLAAVASINHTPSHGLSPWLMEGLTAVVATLAFAMARFAFSQGYLSNYYLTDASRRSLALAGAQHFLWDCLPNQQVLAVGDELAKSLGYDVNVFKTGSAHRGFASLLHPTDERAYASIVSPGHIESGGVIEQELRLVNAAGDYQWFMLKARGFPGPGPYAERLIGTLTDITRSKLQEDKLINEAVRDPVTGLPSRAIFMDRLEREIDKPMGLPVRVVLIAIERFKVLNDGLGHDLGDQLLLATGQRIAENLNPEESLTRISGSMFAVMYVEGIARRNVEELAEKLLSELGQPISIATQQVYISPTIGISLSSADGHSADDLRKQAASALHAAQADSQKSVKFFDAGMKDERADNVALEADLRRAIDRHEIEVHYQPLIHLPTGSVAGLEALARWNHPTRGPLSPGEFIGMAEEAGLINEIGDLILSEAARQLGIWQRTLIRNSPVYVAVNVSADQLSDTNFLDRIEAIISREGLPPQSLKIELTESVVMRYPERTRQLIIKLRTIGVGVACDDFGTGFSNLASLRDLHFDTLKMDKSFIAPEALDGRGGLILSTVVELAHSLGMVVVAEGVEAEDQLDMLLMLGCDLGQGYLLGEPKPARELTNLLAIFPPVQSPVVPQQQGPKPGEAPMAPRIKLFPRELFELPDRDELAILEPDVEPEELPSIYAVEPKPKRKIIAKKKPVVRTPLPKTSRKTKKATRRK